MEYGSESERAAMLAQIITDNVGNMNQELAQTDSGKLKQAENALGDLNEKLGKLTKGAMPLVIIGSLVLQATLQMIKFVAMIRAAAAAVGAWNIQQKMLNVLLRTGINNKKVLNALLLIGSGNASKAAQGLKIYSNAAKGSAAAATVLKVALRGLIIASGIGVAIAVVTGIIAHFSNVADEATDSTDNLSSAQARAKRAAEEMEQVRQQEIRALADTRTALDLNIGRLRDFKGTKEEEKKIVNEMNDTYGETMGYFSSVADWYKALTSNSEAYCKQMVIEARTRMLANQIAQKEAEKDAIIYNSDGSLKKYSKQNKTTKVEDGYDYKVGPNGHLNQTVRWKDVEVENSSDWAEANKSVRQLNTEVGALTARMQSAAKESSEIKFNVKGSSKRPESGPTHFKPSRSKGISKSQELIANPKSKEDYQNNIDVLAKKYTGEDTDEQKQIVKDISLYRQKLRAIELTEMAAKRPTELNTLQDIGDELSYQNALRQSSAFKDLPGIDAEIKRLEELKAAKEKPVHTEVPVDEIKTYAQLNDEMSYYQWLVENGSEKERVYAQERINALDKVKRKWDEALADLKKPGDISTLDNIEKLDDAISYIDGKIKTANDKERAELQRTKMAYEDKRAAQMRSVEIPQALHEADQINKLTGKAYKVKIQGMGFDELTEKINDLQAMLNDTENPVTDEQRKDIESLISTYRKWRKEGIDAFDTFSSGWDNVKGIGGGIESLTSALSGNANAWQTVTGIVDSFIQIYQGVQTIVGIINMLTKATQDHETAEKSDALAVQSKTAATVMSTAATTTDAAVSEVNAGAKSGEAIANATAEGAKMPFPLNLVAIAAGVAAVVGALASIGSFATGGIVGGSSYSGDKLFARVNSGEMILNSTQQRNLFRMINTPRVNPGQLQPIQIAPDLRALNAIAGIATGQPVIIGGTLRASGRDIVAVLANETRIGSKSGRRTNIKL